MNLEWDRRRFLAGGVVAAAVALGGLRPIRAQVTGGTVAAAASVKALVFDTFGTLVDWRGSIIEEGAAWGRAKGLDIDWPKFADRWRAGYPVYMQKVRSGELPWTNVDGLHRMILVEVLVEFGIQGLSADEKEHWNRVWHRLKPWPDTVAGLTRLKTKYVIAPMSNGNIALITNMAKRAGIPWDAILGAELVQHYKPDKEVYLSAAGFLGVQNEEVMMVAAHRSDLDAARSYGLRTGFIHRPNEFGGVRAANVAQQGDYDVVAADAVDLARQMGA
jgi:2-haloacid dehalogenase